MEVILLLGSLGSLATQWCKKGSCFMDGQKVFFLFCFFKFDATTAIATTITMSDQSNWQQSSHYGWSGEALGRLRQTTWALIYPKASQHQLLVAELLDQAAWEAPKLFRVEEVCAVGWQQRKEGESRCAVCGVEGNSTDEAVQASQKKIKDPETFDSFLCWAPIMVMLLEPEL